MRHTLRRIDLRHSRTDRVGLNRPVVRPDGSMIVEGIVAREGIMEYVQPDGRVLREFVSASTLRETAATLVGLPVTMEHPTDEFGNGVQVTPDNFADFAVGSVVSAEFDNETRELRADLSIMRRDILTAVDDGKVELSPGYDAEVDNAPGSNEHGAFDAQQTWRGYNHVAFVDEARGGLTVRARVDSAGHVINNPRAARQEPPRGPQTMNPNPNLLALAALVGLSEAFATDNDAIPAIRRKVDGLLSDNTAKDTELTRLRTDAASKADQVDPEEFQRLKDENDELRGQVDAMNAKAEMDALDPMLDAYGMTADKSDSADDVYRKLATKITGDRYDSKSNMDAVRGLVQGHYAGKFGGKSKPRQDDGNRPTERTDNDSREGSNDLDPFGRPIARTDAAPREARAPREERTDADRQDGRKAGEDAWSQAFDGDDKGGRRDGRDDRGSDALFRPGASAVADRHADSAFIGRPPQQ